MATMKPDDERTLVTQLIAQSMTGAKLVTGWQMSERSFSKGTYRVHFQRPLLDGSDPFPMVSVRARYRWNGSKPRRLSYTAIYRVI